MKAERAWKIFLLAALVPVLTVLAWHSANTVYPRADASDYFRTSFQIHQFLDQGLWSGLKAAYLERGWRPIFFPVLGVPALWITGGDVLWAVGLTMLSIFFLLLGYVFLVARTFLSPWRAGLATLYMGTIPWLIDRTSLFMSELAMILCGVAALYHLFKSNQFQERTHALLFGAWLGLGLIIRPAELGLSLAAILLFYIFGLFRAGKIGFREVVLISLPPAMFLGCFFLFPDSPRRLAGVGLGLVFALSLLSFRARRYSLNQNFVLAYTLLFGIAAVWWIPGLKGFLAWVGVATGEMAKDAHVMGQKSVLEAIEMFFFYLGGPAALFLLALGLLGVWRRGGLPKRFYLGFVGVLLAVLPPLVAISQTPDIDMRRLYLSFTLLHLFLAVWVLSSEFSFLRARVAVLGVFVCLQIGYLWGQFGAVRETDGFRKFGAIWTLPYGPPIRGGDPSRLIDQRLRKIPIRNSRIAVLSILGMDTSTFQLLESLRGAGNSFNYPQLFGETRAGMAKLLEYDYVLVDATTPILRAEKDRPGYERLTQELRERLGRKEVERVGFRVLERLDVKGKSIVLLKRDT